MILHAWESDRVFSRKRKSARLLQQQDDIYGNYSSIPDRGQISGFPDGEAEFARCLSP